MSWYVLIKKRYEMHSKWVTIIINKQERLTFRFALKLNLSDNVSDVPVFITFCNYFLQKWYYKRLCHNRNAEKLLSHEQSNQDHSIQKCFMLYIRKYWKDTIIEQNWFLKLSIFDERINDAMNEGREASWYSNC